MLSKLSILITATFDFEATKRSFSFAETHRVVNEFSVPKPAVI